MKKRIKTTQYKHGDTTVYRADVQMQTKLGIWLTVCRIEDPVKWYVEARAEEAKAYMEDERYGCRCKQNRHAHGYQYLSDAAYLYSEKKGQRYVCRAEMIKRLINKLERRCGE